MQVQTPKYLSYLSLSLHVNSPPLWSKVIFTSCGEYNHSLITHLPVSLFLLTKSCLCFQPVDNITSLWIQLNFRQSNTLNYLVVHLPSATSPCPWSLLQPQWDSLRKMILKCPCYFMLKSLQRVQCFRIFRYISPFACNHPSFFKNSTDSSQCSIYPSRLHTHTPFFTSRLYPSVMGSNGAIYLFYSAFLVVMYKKSVITASSNIPWGKRLPRLHTTVLQPFRFIYRASTVVNT